MYNCNETSSDKFKSAVDKVKAVLLSNASDPGSQRGLLLPWLFDGDEDLIHTQCSAKVPVATSINCSDRRMSDITEMYQQFKGIEKLYSWQDDCLKCSALSDHRNLLIAMPTSAGKTLVAEVLMLREILLYNRAVLLILPYVSLVQEKVRGLIPLSLRFGFSVEEYAGGRGTFPPPIRRRRQSLYIATIEKASSLVSAFIDPTLHGSKKRSVREIGLVIVDEVHMIGDGERGALMESTLIKLRAGFPSVQIVTMSATVGNLNELAACFNAEVFHRDFRPVPLHEYVMCGKALYKFSYDKANGTGFLERAGHNSEVPFPGQKLHPSMGNLDKNLMAQINRIDPDNLFVLIGDLIYENKQSLVFCSTRRGCENVASLIAKILSTLPAMDCVDRSMHLKRQALVANMIAENDGQCCPILQRTLTVGVAYHHAGMMPNERTVIEQAYAEGTITVLCCTSTLAAGVNLPARRVIIRSPYVASIFLTPDRYRQMAGRAGRAKLDTLGQSVIMCNERELEKVTALMSAPLAPCISCLPSSLPNLCLELVSIGLVDSLSSLSNIISSFSLWCRQSSISSESLDTELTAVMNRLVDAGLMQKSNIEGNNEKQLRTTALGRATMAASLTPKEASSLLSDLKQAQSMLTLASPLHLLYLVIPNESVAGLTDHVDFSILAREINKLQQNADLTALNLLNLSESYVARMRGAGSTILLLSSSSVSATAIATALPYARLQLALALRSIWYGASYWEAAGRLGLSRGAVFQLMSTATAFAHAAHRFAAQLQDLWPMSDLLLSLNRRLVTCPLNELAELLDVPGVHYGRARQLARAGYTTLAVLAAADPVKLCREIENLPRRTAGAIVDAARFAVRENIRQLQDAADSIVEDALTAAAGDTSPPLAYTK